MVLARRGTEGPGPSIRVKASWLLPPLRWSTGWSGPLVGYPWALHLGSAPVGSEQVPGNHQPLDLAGAFVNLGDACVAVVALGWHLCHVAHASQDLDGLPGTVGCQGQDRPHGGPAGEGPLAHFLPLNLGGPLHAPFVHQDAHLVADGGCGLRCSQLGHGRFLSTGDGGVRHITLGRSCQHMALLQGLPLRQ